MDPHTRNGWRLIGILARSAALALAIAVTGTAGAQADDITGYARTIDGDTVVLDGEHIRLYGIDAPEKKQTCLADGQRWACGRSAKQFLIAATEGRVMRCHGSKRDRYGRLIAVCYVDGQDINAAMVREGWAVAYRRYALDYVSEEGEAQSAGRGMWRGTFVQPAEWRHGAREIAGR